MRYLAWSAYVVLLLSSNIFAVGERGLAVFKGAAQHMVQAINAADFEDLRKVFNADMLKAFPADKCRKFFQAISSDLGKITKLETPTLKDQHNAVFILRFERGTLDFTLTLDAKDQVAGMLFVPHSELPVPDKNATKLRLPFTGRWLVVWGGDTAKLNHHHNTLAQRFAFDLIGAGDDGSTHRGTGGRNEDYYAFGRELLAPAAGTVIEVIDGVRDNVPHSLNPFSALGNAVFIQHGPNEISVLAHLKQGSVNVKVGEHVKTGQIVGQCGNSGNSSEPHLHYHLQNSPIIQDATGIKCFFAEVVVEKDGSRSAHQRYSPVKGDIIGPHAGAIGDVVR